MSKSDLRDGKDCDGGESDTGARSRVFKNESFIYEFFIEENRYADGILFVKRQYIDC